MNRTSSDAPNGAFARLARKGQAGRFSGPCVRDCPLRMIGKEISFFFYYIKARVYTHVCEGVVSRITGHFSWTMKS
jgi:hypothetical protein